MKIKTYFYHAFSIISFFSKYYRFYYKILTYLLQPVIHLTDLFHERLNLHQRSRNVMADFSLDDSDGDDQL